MVVVGGVFGVGGLFFLAAQAQQLLNAALPFFGFDLSGSGLLGGGFFLGGAALGHGGEHGVFALGKGVVKAVGAGDDNGDADFGL